MRKITNAPLVAKVHLSLEINGKPQVNALCRVKYHFFPVPTLYSIQYLADSRDEQGGPDIKDQFTIDEIRDLLTVLAKEELRALEASGKGPNEKWP